MAQAKLLLLLSISVWCFLLFGLMNRLIIRRSWVQIPAPLLLIPLSSIIYKGHGDPMIFG